MKSQTHVRAHTLMHTHAYTSGNSNTSFFFGLGMALRFQISVYAGTAVVGVKQKQIVVIAKQSKYNALYFRYVCYFIHRLNG